MPRVSAEQRRQDLVAAALDLLVNEGPAAVTARRIAEQAGASLGTVHYAFRDMDELNQIVADELLARVNDAFAGVRTERGLRVTVEDLLAAWGRWLREFDGTALAYGETLLTLVRAGTSNANYAAAHGMILDLLTLAAEHEAEPPRIALPQLAHLVLVTADGLGLVHLVRGDARQTARDLRAMASALQSLI
jgi:AcrR family transcriptional regulator